MHLYADISSHGFGHLAISAAILHALGKIAPDLRLTVKSALPEAKLRERIGRPFAHLPGASDFGYVMHDATHIDFAASAARYRQAHADWPTRVAEEAARLRGVAPDLVFSNVSYLALAGAAQAGIPAIAACSLNWAEMFACHYGHEAWAAPIYQEMLAAYRSAAAFLRLTPGMTMAALDNARTVGPVAARGRRRDLGLGGARAVLVAMGGVAHRLPVEDWPRRPGLYWLVGRDWGCAHPDALAYEDFGLGFTDLLCSVDAVITKPGYGTFTEAACNGIPVIYQRRTDWPEQDCLADWLHAHGRATGLDEAPLRRGEVLETLDRLWAMPAPPRPRPTGARQVARLLDALGRGLPI